jgi:excisionase family DNA binding protein
VETRHTSEGEDWLSLGQAAALVGISADTLRRWADDGLVPVQQIAPGRHRRFRREELLAAVENRSEAS